MAPPIVEALSKTVLINDSILVSELFTVDDLDNVSFLNISDFSSSIGSGNFSLDGVPFANGDRFNVAASDLPNLRYTGAASVTFEGFRIIAYANDGSRSNPMATARIYTTRANTTAPHVVAPSFEVLTDEYVVGTAFMAGYDPDGFPLGSYTVTDGSKILNMVASGGFATVTSYQHNFSTSDSITIRGASDDAFNVTAYVAVLDQHRFRFKLPGVEGTAEGDLLATVNDSSYFSVNGVQMPQGIPFTVAAEDIGQVRYYGNGEANNKNVHLSAFDGVDTSFEKRGLITQTQNVNRPVVQFGRFSTPAEQDFYLEDAVVVLDADGSTMDGYRFQDTSPHESNGSLYVYGVKQPKTTWIQVAAKDLGGVTFKTPRVGFDQQIRVAAYDGRFWSAPSTVSISSTVPIVPAVIDVVTPQFVIEQQKTVGVGSLFTKVDGGPAHTRMEVYEPSVLDSSGQLKLGPTVLAPAEIHEVSSANFNSRLNFLTGNFWDRQVDTIYARATNDQANVWSPWVKVDVHTEPEIEDALTSGASWNGILPRNSDGKLEISYSFMQKYPTYPSGEAVENAMPEHFAIFTEAQRITAREWFRHLEEFADLQFVEMADSDVNILGQQGGVIRMANYGVVNSTAGAYAFYPSTNPSGGDMWFNRQPPETGVEFANWPGPFVNGFNTDNYSGYTFLHEMGHALGLKHTFDGIPSLPPEADIARFSVMSYTAGDFYPGSYGSYDMYELQQLYGANNSHSPTDDVYSIANTWNRQVFYETIWDGSGNDTLSAAGTPRNATVDLRQGQQSTIGSFLQGNVTIAYGAEIENATGSRQDDVLIGNSLSNVLFGNDGNDEIRSGQGRDFMLGAAGNDTYVWGVGDHDDIINEQGNNDAADMIRIESFPTINRIEEDFTFAMDGNDLLINLALDGGITDNTLRIKNQTVLESQVETLVINGFRIDLTSLNNQVSPSVNVFKATGSSSANGALVVPV